MSLPVPKLGLGTLRKAEQVVNDSFECVLAGATPTLTFTDVAASPSYTYTTAAAPVRATTYTANSLRS